MADIDLQIVFRFRAALEQRASEGGHPPAQSHASPYCAHSRPSAAAQVSLAYEISEFLNARRSEKNAAASELSYAFAVTKRLIQWLEDTAESSVEADGGAVADELYGIFGKLAGECAAVAAAQPRSRSESELSDRGACFDDLPLLRYRLNSDFSGGTGGMPGDSAADGTCFADFRVDHLTASVRRSPLFSDLSCRVWPASFSLVDSLMLLLPDLADAACNCSGADNPGQSQCPAWACVELGSGAGLAGIMLAKLLAHRQRAALRHGLSTQGDTAPPRAACAGQRHSSRCRAVPGGRVHDPSSVESSFAPPCPFLVSSITLTDGCLERGVPLLQANVGMNADIASAAGGPLSPPVAVDHCASGAAALDGAVPSSEAARRRRSSSSCSTVRTSPACILGLPVCVHPWVWGGEDKEVDEDKSVALSAPPRGESCDSSHSTEPAAAVAAGVPLASGRSFLCGSDIVYDPAAAALLVAVLRQQLVPRRDLGGDMPRGSGHVDTPAACTVARASGTGRGNELWPLPAAGAWKPALAAVLAAPLASRAHRWRGFPWRSCGKSCPAKPQAASETVPVAKACCGCAAAPGAETEAGQVPPRQSPAFALIASTVRNEDTFHAFTAGLEAAGLRHFDVSGHIEALRAEGWGRAAARALGRCAAGSPLGASEESGSGAAPAASYPGSGGVSSFTCCPRFASVWDAFLVPAGPEHAAASAGRARPTSTHFEPAVAARPRLVSAPARVAVTLILPPLLSEREAALHHATGGDDGAEEALCGIDAVPMPCSSPTDEGL
jgi:hypothetical protein